MRDTSVPPPHRHGALRCAVELYMPLGFNATWAYITSVACPAPDIRRDVAAQSRALDVLEESRSVWLDEMDAFASRRRVEKAAGRRVPRSADMLAFSLPSWPSRTLPSRMGLVGAVANRHAEFRRSLFSDETLLTDGQAARLNELRGALDTSAADYLARLGGMDESASHSVADITRELRTFLAPGHSSLNLYVVPLLRFADLVNYAVRVGALHADT